MKEQNTDVRHHFIREIIEKQDVKLTKVAGDENVVDMFTKAVPIAKLKHCMKLLRVVQYAE